MTEYYKILLDCWRRERQRPDIQPLPDKFHSDMTTYLLKLREEVKNSVNSLKGQIVRKESDHAERMLLEINKMRLIKLVTSELNDSPLEHLNLTPEENRLQVEVRRLIARHLQELKPMAPEQQGIVDEVKNYIVQKQTPTNLQEKQEIALKIVRFLQPLPAIIGVDMKTYGPFKAEDVASIPAQNAENLIRKGIVKVVETEP